MFNFSSKTEINKKFKLTDIIFENIELKDDEKLYYLKHKTSGCFYEALTEGLGELFGYGMLFICGCILYFIIPKNCKDDIEFETLMFLGGILLIVVSLIIGGIVYLFSKRKEKRK